MENSIARQVLALKYRPKRFEDLIGQDTISTTLSLALDTNRLSHAYLLSGLRGSGKTSTARIMAKALVCEKAPTSKPCEICSGCKSANENRHLDIIEMDAASNRGIDDIKDLIEHTKYKPTSAKYKVFIIDEVHMLTTQAFNALLKTLEEPPEFVKFILATTDPLKLPATILSRTQHFRFKRISEKNVIHHLSHILNLENIEFETPALEILTRAGQGSLRDTLTLLDQSIIFSKGIITTVTVTDMMGMIDPSFLDNIFNIILSKKDIREIVTLLEDYEVGQVLDEISIYLKQKMLLNDQKFDIYLFDRFFRIIADSKQLLNMNSDSSFVLILSLSKMVEAVNLKTIEEVINEVQEIQIEDTQINKQNDIKNISTINEPNKLKTKFQILIDTIYDKNYELGECFEKSFQFSSYENEILKINSTAIGECKTNLYKNFAHIKQFVSDIYGIETQLEFEKINKEVSKEMARIVQPSIPKNTETEVKIESDVSPSSCIASMSDIKNPSLAQVELNIESVLNSKMMETAMKLLQPSSPPKIKSKL
jgi:DNA polymerase-3 subunit gamma/tau